MAVAVLLLLTGCGKEKSDTIKMATKPMTEQLILGSVMKRLVEEETDLTLALTEGVGGGTSNIQPALEKGEFDFYPEYTGTGWNAVLREDSLYREEKFPALQAGYDRLGLQWTGMLGFNNSYGLAVTREAAERYQLECYSDLKGVSEQLVFGAEYDFFERQDGYRLLCGTYDLDFRDTMDLDIGLKYDAIRQKKIDVMTVFTTDGQLSSSDVVVLEDDQGLYPSYVCGFVVRKETLEDHPELAALFQRLEQSISNEEMAAMNDRVESQGESPEEVAAAFLQEKGV